MSRRGTALVPGGLVGEFRVVRELGSRTPSVFVARREAAAGELVVLCRYECADPLVAQMRDTKWIANLKSPNVPRTLGYAAGKESVLVASQFIDGITLQDFLTLPGAREALDLGGWLRVLVDVLAALQAIEELKDTQGRPLGLVHGQIGPADVVLGADGKTRLVNLVRTSSRREHAQAGHLAPEILLGVDRVDARADVYSVGALLWEALSGRRLFEGHDASTIIARRLTESIPRPDFPVPWARPLADLALVALDPKPDARFSSAAAMSKELLAAAGRAISDEGHVRDVVKRLAGARIVARRADLTTRKAMPSSSDVRATSSGAPAPSPPKKPISLKEEESGELKTEVDFAFLRKMYLKAETGEDAPPAVAEEPDEQTTVGAPVLADAEKEKEDEEEDTTLARDSGKVDDEPATMVARDVEEDEDDDGPTRSVEPQASPVAAPESEADEDDPTRSVDLSGEGEGEAERDDPTMSVDLRSPDVQIVQKRAEKPIVASDTLTAAKNLHDLNAPIVEDPSDDSLTAQPSPAYVAMLEAMREMSAKPSTPPAAPASTRLRVPVMQQPVDEDGHTMPLDTSAGPAEAAGYPPSLGPRAETLPLGSHALKPSQRVQPVAAPLPSSAPMPAAKPAAPMPHPPSGPWQTFPQPTNAPTAPPWGPDQGSMSEIQMAQPSRARWVVVVVSLLGAAVGAGLIAWVLTEQPPARPPSEPRTEAPTTESPAPTQLQRPPAPTSKKKR